MGNKQKKHLRLRFTLHPQKEKKDEKKKHLRLRISLHPQKEKTDKQNTETYQCPYCNCIITLEKIHLIMNTITCPQCGNHGILSNIADSDTDGETSIRDSLELPSHFIAHPNKRAKMIGLILIISGLFPLINPIISNIKISITLVFIGTIMLLLISEKRMSDIGSLVKRHRLFISEKVTLLIIVSTLILFLFTNPQDIELFLILLYLCLLIIKELIDEFMPIQLKKRLNIVVTGFFFIFIFIISERILTIINI